MKFNLRKLWLGLPFLLLAIFILYFFGIQGFLFSFGIPALMVIIVVFSALMAESKSNAKDKEAKA